MLKTEYIFILNLTCEREICTLTHFHYCLGVGLDIIKHEVFIQLNFENTKISKIVNGIVHLAEKRIISVRQSCTGQSQDLGNKSR